jgi:hypothetical protein
MNTFILIVLVATFLVLFGMLLGSTLTESLLGARTRRQAAVQRSLNEQFHALEIARKTIAQQRIGESSKPVGC